MWTTTSFSQWGSVIFLIIYLNEIGIICEHLCFFHYVVWNFDCNACENEFPQDSLNVITWYLLIYIMFYIILIKLE